MKYCIILFMILSAVGFAEIDARREIIKMIENAGKEEWLDAPVTINQTAGGALSIMDTGYFIIQHELLPKDVAADPNIIIADNIELKPRATHLVVVTHGWLDKGEEDWPSEMAQAIYDDTDPNLWTCASYDWKGGSVVISSIQAAEYARDIAGPRLASAILSLNDHYDHIHLLAHSAGSWTIDSAAEIIAQKQPQTQFHLTFFDAYVPSKWNPDDLGRIFSDDIKQNTQYWGEHYYTRDITSKVTQRNLKYAFNADITALDPMITEHEFPYRWYLATITGHYTRWDEKKEPVIIRYKNTNFGYARSLEAGLSNWYESRQLKMGNVAIKFK